MTSEFRSQDMTATTIDGDYEFKVGWDTIENDRTYLRTFFIPEVSRNQNDISSEVIDEVYMKDPSGSPENKRQQEIDLSINWDSIVSEVSPTDADSTADVDIDLSPDDNIKSVRRAIENELERATAEWSTENLPFFMTHNS